MFCAKVRLNGRVFCEFLVVLLVAMVVLLVAMGSHPFRRPKYRIFIIVTNCGVFFRVVTIRNKKE